MPESEASALKRAEKLLRTPDARMYSFTSVERRALAAEIDRLRAQLAISEAPTPRPESV